MIDQGETRAVLLGRVSDGDAGQDPETQMANLRNVAQRRGWTIAEEVVLELSAWDQDEAREVWTTVEAALNETGADVLGVWAVDRLARGGIEDVLGKVRQLEHLGVRLFSAQEPFLSTTDKRSRELLLAMLGWSARWESERRSERLKAKARKRRQEAEQGRRSATWGRGQMATREDAEQVLVFKENGKTYREIAEETGFSLGTVSNIANGDHPALADGDEEAAEAPA